MINILHKIGLEAVKKRGDNTLFYSPFRDERTPSFWVLGGKNWKDFGSGDGGDTIKFLMLYYSISFKEAHNLFSLNSTAPTAPINTAYTQSEEKESFMRVKKIKKLENKALLQYCRSRKISEKIAKKYLKEIYYTINNKNYFALYFETDKGGGEVRNKYFKSCFGKKSYTEITGVDRTVVSVYEGFFDFLSMIEIRGNPKCDVIVLNGLEQSKKINLKKYKTINYFLDNGKGGDLFTKKLLEKYGGIDRRYIYRGRDDLNEYLIGCS